MKRATKAMTMNVSARVAVALTACLASCADLELEKVPTVVTTGSHQVLVGQTLQLGAATTNATDTSYTYASSAEVVALVSPLGLVTGVSPGEADIVITGVPSGAVGRHAVVVVASAFGVDAMPGGDGGAGPDATTDTDPLQVPYFDKWKGSAHADSTSEPFAHWNKEGAVPVSCARCHSSEGFIDYLGGDGTVPGRVDAPAPTQSVVRCVTCHDPAASKLSTVTFPSGVTVSELGSEARCMTCHQGRASGADVDKSIAAAALPTADIVSDKLGFLNIHYYPAAATLYAGRAKGGYQYAGQVYDVRLRHVEGYNTCTGCHDPHSLQIKFDECVACHPQAKDLAGAQQIRMYSSQNRDYDGDANVQEGLAQELFGVRDKLTAAMAAYANEKNAPICYQPATYPYFFNDKNKNGLCGADEAVATNGYKTWTPRLVKAAYNFQLATKDPGGFAHNAKYLIQLMHDSIQDLNEALVVKIDMTQAVRQDTGHFNGASEAARRWDAGDAVDASCSRCHGASEGFRFYAQYGVGLKVQETANGLDCATCHTNFGSTFDVLAVPSTTFPSGVVRKEPGNDNLCSNCHSGRSAKATVDGIISSGVLKFSNVHYLPAAATKLGSAAKVGYEYTGKTYAGPLTHMGGVQCTSCHDPVASKHSFRIDDVFSERCRTCHADALGNAENIRLVHLADYDGDKNMGETLPAELAGMAARLLTAMSAVAAPKLCYAHTNPYFFTDTDGNGTCDAPEAVSANAYKAFTPALLKASFNYQLYEVEPGAWAHNFNYMGQLLYDSIEDLGGNVTGLTRP